GARPGPVNLNDSQVLLGILLDKWEFEFKEILGSGMRSVVHELRDVRNKWAHQEQFSTNDAIRALDSIERLLTAVSAAEAAEVGLSRMDLMRLLFDEQRRSEMRKPACENRKEHDGSRSRRRARSRGGVAIEERHRAAGGIVAACKPGRGLRDRAAAALRAAHRRPVRCAGCRRPGLRRAVRGTEGGVPR